jgi:RNA 3'-terminal phosphate cyclase (ATP)
LDLGREAAKDIVEAVKLRACADLYLQDQLIIFMALASGVSRIRSGPLTLHTETAIHVAELLTGAKFKVEQSQDEPGVHFIECQGISFTNKS